MLLSRLSGLFIHPFPGSQEKNRDCGFNEPRQCEGSSGFSETPANISKAVTFRQQPDDSRHGPSLPVSRTVGLVSRTVGLVFREQAFCRLGRASGRRARGHPRPEADCGYRVTEGPITGQRRTHLVTETALVAGGTVGRLAAASRARGPGNGFSGWKSAWFVAFLACPAQSSKGSPSVEPKSTAPGREGA